MHYAIHFVIEFVIKFPLIFSETTFVEVPKIHKIYKIYGPWKRAPYGIHKIKYSALGLDVNIALGFISCYISWLGLMPSALYTTPPLNMPNLLTLFVKYIFLHKYIAMLHSKCNLKSSSTCAWWNRFGCDYITNTQ